jgi:hypothetical protein
MPMQRCLLLQVLGIPATTLGHLLKHTVERGTSRKARVTMFTRTPLGPTSCAMVFDITTIAALLDV